MCNCNKNRRPRRTYSTIIVYRECIFYLTMFLICATILCCHFVWKLHVVEKELETTNQDLDNLTKETRDIVLELRSMELRILVARDDIEDLQSSIKANMEIVKGMSTIVIDSSGDENKILQEQISNLDDLSISDAKVVIESFVNRFPQESIGIIMNTFALIEEQHSSMVIKINEYNQAVTDYNKYIFYIQSDNRLIQYPVIDFDLYVYESPRNKFN